MKPEKLKMALDVLKKKVPGVEPDAYWDKGEYVVFRVNTVDKYGINFYKVSGLNVTGTIPPRENLTPDTMKKL